MIMLFAVSASAATEGYYTYEVENDEATITDVDTSISGDITTPSTLGGYTVTKIGEDSFRACNNITEITIANTVTNIEDFAFYYCKNLKKISIPASVRYIGENFSVFVGCENLESFSVDKGNQYFFNDEYGVLYYRYKHSYSNDVHIELVHYPTALALEEYTIPDGVDEISYGAIVNVKSLKYVNLPESLASIDSRTFEDCDNIVRYSMEQGNEFYYTDEYGVLIEHSYNEYKRIFRYPAASNLENYAIADEVYAIYSEAFKNAKKLKTVTIPNSVKEIRGLAFYGCTSLDNVVIPSSVTEIGGNAFRDCESITSVTISSGVEKIGGFAFYGCKLLKEIVIPESVTVIGEAAFGDCKSIESILIPDTVISIGKACFYDCDSLKTVTIGKGISVLPAQFFMYCENLEEVIFALGTKVEEIDSGAFYECSSLKEIALPYVTTIGNSAFENCSSLKKVEIPVVTTIESWAFRYCSALEKININSGVISIGESAFSFCDSLEEISVDKENGYYCSDETGALYDKEKTVILHFPAKSSTTQLVIPDSVKRIEEYAFYDCSNIESIVYPAELDVDIYAFDESIHTSLKHTAYKGSDFIWTEVPRGDKFHINFNPETDITVNFVEGTCQTLGVEQLVCSCGYVYSSTPTVLGDHSYTSRVTTPATHTKLGVMTYSCACGDYYTKSIPKLEGHTYTSKITTQPTHLKEGVETFTCACGDTYTKSVSKLTDHTYTSKVTKNPTHLETGVKTFTCACGASYTETIAKTKEHSYFVLNIVEPTCESEGYTTYMCECGHTYNGDKKSATGHNYNGDSCVNCGESKTASCSCNCHKSGIMGIIWKILNFFYKIFGMNKTCACGVAHY